VKARRPARDVRSGCAARREDAKPERLPGLRAPLGLLEQERAHVVPRRGVLVDHVIIDPEVRELQSADGLRLVAAQLRIEWLGADPLSTLAPEVQAGVARRVGTQVGARVRAQVWLDLRDLRVGGGEALARGDVELLGLASPERRPGEIDRRLEAGEILPRQCRLRCVEDGEQLRPRLVGDRDLLRSRRRGGGRCRCRAGRQGDEREDDEAAAEPQR
jgi:hypothetical protein